MPNAHIARMGSLPKPRLLPAGAERGRLFFARGERGSLEMFAPVESLIITRGVGHLELSMAEQWVRRSAHLWVSKRPIAVFNDWELAATYDTAARRLLTSWVVEHRSHFEGAWFLTGSRLVAMGVAAAGVAAALAGVTMHASLSRPRWEELLRAKLAGGA